MRRLFVTIFISIASAAIAGAQEPMKLSLADCMDYALKHNYTIKNARLDVLIQHIQNNETLSASYPHVNGKAELDNFYIPQNSFVDFSTFPNPDTTVHIPKGTVRPVQFTIPYTSNASVTASQLIFDGSVFVAWKARNTVMEFARLNSAVTEENVRYNVYKAYNSLVIAYRQYEIIKSSLGYARSLERDLEITRTNGFAEKIDVERTSVQVNNLASDSIRIGNMLTVSEDMLKYTIGMNINTNIILTDTNIEERRKVVNELLTEEQSYDRVPEYQVANKALSLSEYNLKRYQLSALPTLNAFWTYGANDGSYHFDPITRLDQYYHNSYAMWGVQLNVPIFNGTLRINQLREAKLSIEKSQNNIENMKQTIDFQVAQSRTSLKNAVLQVQSQRRNMELSNDVLDLAQRKYKAGVGSNLEVTQAQTDQLRAQTNYFSALLDLINAEADLKKALGLLK